MDFLIYSRGASSALADAEHDSAMDEQHWSYMDGFAHAMTARGPTLGADRETWTGSLHVLDLPSPDAARDFVAREPYNEAGLFEEHFIWRFANLLGQTMWQFAGSPDEPRFLVIARAAGVPEHAAAVPFAALPRELRARLIVYGELRNLETDAPEGVACAIQAPTPAALDDLIADSEAGLDRYADVLIADWEFGGRR